MIAVSTARAWVDCRAACERALDRGAEARLRQPLAGEGLQRAHRADQLGRVGGGVGERVLRGARAAPHQRGRRRPAAARSPGSPASTNTDSRGLVTTIMTTEPMNSTRLRSATDTDVPTALLICVVSAVSREMISPVLARVEEGGRQHGQVREHGGAQVGDDALAERGDEVVARARSPARAPPRPRSSRRNTVDQPDALGREAEIDHAADRERHDQRRERPRPAARPARPRRCPR